MPILNFRLGKRSQQYNVANKDLFVIPIELLTNECIECTLLSTSIGQECLNNVCQKIGLQQVEYFGLLFKSRKHIDQWVDLNKPLKKQLDKYSSEVRLYFRLQYFVPNFHFLSDEISRYHYFCAMKGLVIDGRIACNRDDAILLASFSLQAEFGDYSPERHTVEYLNNFALFPKSMLTSKIAHDVLVECAINAYRNLQGVPANIAEIYYISEAQQREGFGQEGFPAKDLDNGQDVCLGVCIRGIFVISTEANTVELFKWGDIANLIHQKKTFTIERNVGNFRKSYSTFDSDYASCIWRICVEQHQYFMKGIQTTETDTIAEQANMTVMHLAQNKDLFAAPAAVTATGNQKKSLFVDNGNGYNQTGPDSSLYETISKSALSLNATGGHHPDMGSAPMQEQQYNMNGYFDNKIEHCILKKRSSTDPIDLKHIELNCANGNAPNRMKPEFDGSVNSVSFAPKMNTVKPTSCASSPLANSASNTPIYENQLNPNDLTFEQRKKLLPTYKSPPNYETYIKRKYSVMAHLSQSMSSIPSRLASHSQINSSSATSLANPYLNAVSCVNGARILASSSAMSVPYLLQQQQQQQQKLQQRQPVFLSSMYRDYNDLSCLDIEKSAQLANHRDSLPPSESISGNTFNPVVFNQLRYQKQKMQSSGMFAASSPELNNLNLFQKRNMHMKNVADQLTNNNKMNGVVRHLESNESNLKGLTHLPPYFASVPDLTFQTPPYHGNHVGGEASNNEHRKLNLVPQANRTKSNAFPFNGRNFRVMNAQSNSGSEPNLFNDSSASCNPNYYNLQRPKHLVEHLGNLHQQRSNSIGMLEPQPRHIFNYSISSKIDEAPELTANKPEECSTVAAGNGDAINRPYLPSPYQVDVQQQQPHVIYANLNNTASREIVHHHVDNGSFHYESISNNRTSELPSANNRKIAGQSDNSIIGGNSTVIAVNQPISNNRGQMVVSQLNNSYETNHHQQHQPPHPHPSHTSHHNRERNLVSDFKINLIDPKKANQPVPHHHALNTNIEKVCHQDSGTMTSKQPVAVNFPKNSRIIVFDKCFEGGQDFTREFELLPRMNPTAKFTTASLAENILKNRFRDILPYEENRVKLTPTKDNKHGFINASHVHMKFGTMKQHYIAAQGPLPTTTLDFWQMVFEQNISLIVMVTNFTESGAQKCYTYLPLTSESGKNVIRFGDFEIICSYTSVSSTFITSLLTLCYNGQKRQVTHLRYTDWNDHSIPGDLQGFLSFLSEMDAIYRRNTRDGSGFGKKRANTLAASSPILVHCSAGAGRSGVVILCDALLKCLDHNFSEPIDIPRALIQLRFQRMISVQHCEQFRFVCQVLSQYLSNSRLI